MHFPINFVIGNTTIPSHLVFDILAYYVGLSLFFRLRKTYADQLSVVNRQLIIVAAIGGAFIGATTLGAVEHFSSFLHPTNWLYYLSNRTIVGGLLGGWIAVEIVKKIIGEKKSSGDIFVFPLIFAMAIGRIGCFLTGVSDMTVGNPSSLPWAMDQGDGIPRHPTSLYEILFLLLFAGALYWWYSRKRRRKDRRAVKYEDGMLFKYFLTGYCIFRFFIEFIKPVEPIVFGLSSIQLACAACVLYYLIVHGRRMFEQLIS